MSKNRLFFYLMVAVISLSCFSTSYSQVECPGDNDPCPLTAWTTNTFEDFVGIGAANFKVFGSYEWRFCNDYYRIRK